MNLDEIHSNHVWICVRCRELITIENYSGWEAFTENGQTTQPVCSFCNLVDSFPAKKEENDGRKGKTLSYN